MIVCVLVVCIAQHCAGLNVLKVYVRVRYGQERAGLHQEVSSPRLVLIGLGLFDSSALVVIYRMLREWLVFYWSRDMSVTHSLWREHEKLHSSGQSPE